MPALKKCVFPQHVFEQLSRKDCQNFIEAIHYTTKSETTSDVKDALVQFKNLFPFSRVIGGLARLNAKGAFDGFTNVINVSYPDEWIRLYWQNGYFEADPIFQAALQQSGSHHWQTTYQKTPSSSEKQREFVDTARKFGLVDGITTGFADPRYGVATFCSFASDDTIDATRYLPLVEYFGYHIHLALLRTAPATTQPPGERLRQLTPRELTVLNWIKNGKTNWEIAMIMSITERTIRFHIENIFSKLGVTSRSQAAAAAIKHGLPNVV